MRIVVLGGGLAGLSAAGVLGKRFGHDVTVLEAAASPGGLCRTWTRPDGDRFDFGPHFFHSKDPAILKTVSPAIAGRAFPVTLYAKSFIGGRFFDYPVSADNVLALPPGTAAQAVAELQATDREAREKARTFEEYVVALVGRTLFDIFFRSYTEKLWGLSVSEIPASWAPSRISFRRSDKRFFPDEWCVYFDRGIGDLVAHFLDEAPARLRTGLRPERIDRDGRGWRVRTPEGTETFDAVFSTIPLTSLLECLGAGRIRPLGYRAMMVAYQEVLRPEALPADWVYFPESRYDFTRLFERNRSARTRPSADRTSVTMEVPCAPGDALWSLADEDLASRLRAQLTGTGLFSRKELGGFQVVRERFVYPVHDHGSDEGLRANLETLSEFPGVISAGRLGRFRYMNMDETVAQAREAAEMADASWSGRIP